MMNFGLRCAQLMAERGDTRKMNILERTALHYRLERIGQELPEEKTIIYQEDYQWTKRQWDSVQQLKSMVLFLQRKLNDSLKEKKPPSPPSYIYSSIKEEGDTPDKREVN